MAEQEFTAEELATEEWRDLYEYPGYQVSNIGRVRRVKITILKLQPGRNPGYLDASLFVNKRYIHKGVHQLVAAAFIGPRPKGMLVNHKDTKKRNNKHGNLEYATPKGNSQHASENGLLLVGEDNNQSKLTEQQVVEIIKRLANGESSRSVCRDFPVSDIVVGLIKQNRAWRHIPRPVSPHLGRRSTGRTYGENSSSAKITKSDVIAIRLQHDKGHSLSALVAAFGIKKSQVWRIVTRQSWKHV